MNSVGLGIKTFYRFISVNPQTEKETELSGWSGNTLLTTGRQELSKRNWFTALQIGRSSTLPAAGQTSLIDYVAGSSTLISSSYAAQATPPYYGYKRKRYRFYDYQGIAGENLNEVAIGWSTTVQTSIMARALIEDITGTQVTVTPLAGEWLDVEAEVRYYPPLIDVTGTVALKGVTYDYIMRAANVTNSAIWAENIGDQILAECPANSSWYVTDDDIGTIDQGPSGLVTNCDNNAEWNGAYVDNSYERKMGLSAGANGWNSLTGKLLRSMRWLTTAGAYQIQFDSQANPGFGIPKDNTWSSLGVGFVLGWDEKV